MQHLRKRGHCDPLKILFLISCFIIFYTVVGYPFVILFLSRFAPKRVEKGEELLPLSVILCARDEAQGIARRIENLLDMEYPEDLLEVIVVSDGSTDGTEAVIKQFEERGVRCIQLQKPSGKAYAVDCGIAAASHEVVLLCDARQRFAPDVARKLVSYFEDVSVGAVSGRLLIQSSGSNSAVDGVGGYWNYEVWLRNAESKSGSVIGVTGAIYALRKSMYSPIPQGTVLDDVLIPMQVIIQGGRVLYDESAIAYDTPQDAASGELTRKIRTLYGNLQLVNIRPLLLCPWRNPAWFRFVSHKMLRLLLPFLFIACLLSSFLAGGVWGWVGGAQLLFWLFSIICYYKKYSFKMCVLPSGLLLLNVAVVLAWYRWITRQGDVWQESSSLFVNKND